MSLSVFQTSKLSLVAMTGLSKDALHVYFGLAIFLAVSLLLRKPLRTLLPWLVVLCAACAGELLDMRDDLRLLGHWRYMASLHDLVNTMFWPTVLALLARLQWLRS